MDRNYIMNRAGVDEVSAELARWMKKSGITKENAIKIRLTMEELLYRICEHFDESVTGTLVMKKRFGTPILRFRYRGESFDPTVQEENEEDETIRLMMARLGLAPEWRYQSGVNELILRGPKAIIRSEMLLAAAGVLAIILGMAGGLLPGEAKTGLIDYLLNPIAGTFMNALNTFVGFMIFLSVVSGICAIGSVTDFSKMGRYVISRLILNTFVVGGIGFLILIPFHRFNYGTMAQGETVAGTVIEILTSIIPSNPIAPFADRNMLQIIFMAVMTGTGLLVLEERTAGIRKLILEAMELFMEVIGIVCKVLPLYVFSSLSAFILQNGIGVFVKLWKPIVLTILVNILYIAGKIAFTSMRLHLPPGKLFKKLEDLIFTGFLTGSSAACYGKMVDTCDKNLGVAQEFYRFALPFANLLTGETISVAIAAILFYLAEMQGVPVNLTWFITVWIMGSIFSMAMPPVSGGFLVCIGAIMSQVSVSTDGLAVAGILSIIFDFVLTGGRVGGEMMEMALQAVHFKKIDRNILEK